MRLESTDAVALTVDWPLVADLISAVGPFAILASAIIAGSVAWKTSRRDRWWTRVQWALDHMHSGDMEKARTGLAVLDALFDRAPSDDERAIIEKVNEIPLARLRSIEEAGVEVVELDVEPEEAADGA